MEKFKYFKLNIKDIIPQQHYLCREKYNQVVKYMTDNDDYGIIYVIEYKNKIFSVDGHHRLFYLYQKGIEEIDVVCEIEDNENKLYQYLAEEAIQLNFSWIGDLKDRFVETSAEYKKLWIDKCQNLLKTL